MKLMQEFDFMNSDSSEQEDRNLLSPEQENVITLLQKDIQKAIMVLDKYQVSIDYYREAKMFLNICRLWCNQIVFYNSGSEINTNLTIKSAIEVPIKYFAIKDNVAVLTEEDLSEKCSQDCIVIVCNNVRRIIDNAINLTVTLQSQQIGMFEYVRVRLEEVNMLLYMVMEECRDEFIKYMNNDDK